MSNTTSDFMVFSAESSTSASNDYPDHPKKSKAVEVRATRSFGRKKHKLENAVYAHIQAVRALGRKKINTIEIANALSIPVPEVNRVIDALKKKGVKVL